MALALVSSPSPWPVQQAVAPICRQADDLYPLSTLVLAGIHDILIIEYAAGYPSFPSSCWVMMAAMGSQSAIQGLNQADGLAQAFPGPKSLSVTTPDALVLE